MNLSGSAYDYLSEGLNPLPLWNNKAPMLKEGHPYLYQLIKEKDIPGLFDRAEKIGIACGDVSNGFECIDFDGKDGEPIGDIFKQYLSNPTVRRIVTSHKLPIIKTPSGGFHIYYRHSVPKQPPRHLSSWESGKVMIETRGHGSYVATIPSAGYKQLKGTELLEISRITDEERDDLFIVAEGFTQFIKTKSEKSTGGSWPTKFDTSTVWGRYNETETEEAKDLLIKAGWEFFRIRKDGVEYWQRPDKDSKNPTTSATFGKCHNMFYCWTDNADGFEKETAYSLFDVFMILRHGGDHKAATLELEERYNIKHYKTEAPKIVLPDPESSPGHFPIEVFPESIQDFINELNKSLNYSKDFISVAMMFVIATLNGNKYKLRVKNGWNAPTIFWFAVVGEPGTMKTHPVATIISPINQIDKNNKHIHDYEYDLWEQEKIENKKSTSKKPVFKQIMINDITLESLHEVSNYNKRGLGYYKDELTGFLNDMNKYRNGSDEQFWLESFNNNSYIVNRVTKKANLIEDAMINIIGTIQPSILSKITKEYSGAGMTDRFLYTSAETNVLPLSPYDINEESLDWWTKSIQTINSLFNYIDNKDTVIISLQPGALNKMIEIDTHTCELQKSNDITDAFKNYLSKSKTYIPRFALLIALFDTLFNNTQLYVDENHVMRANKIMNYFIESARSVFSAASKSSEIKEVAASKKGMTKSEQIVFLSEKGFKSIDIANNLLVSKSYVSRILSQIPPKKS